ncbi:MAG: DUF4294 domain-containing protein [Cryomorphaceae bacterium]
MKHVLNILIVSLWMVCMAQEVIAQDRKPENGIIMLAEVFDGDTFPVKYLPNVMVVGERQFVTKRERAKWSRMKYNVKKVYPYAKLAGELLEKYKVPLDTITDKRERKKYFRLIEKELMEEFDDDIRTMSTTQGRILIKLIDRETSNTSYEIVQEFRGSFTAFFWQGISRVFGHDLKSRYQPAGEDQEIERIILLIEAGMI